MNEIFYQVVAIPSTTTVANSSIDNNNDNQSPSEAEQQLLKTIDDFRQYVKSKVCHFCITTTNNYDNDNNIISIDQITRLVNEEDGDCYLVGLEMNLLRLLDDDDFTTREKFENVTDWLHPLAEVWVNGPQPLPLAPPYGYDLNDVTYNHIIKKKKTSNTDDGDDDDDTIKICQMLQEYGMVIVPESQRKEEYEPTTTIIDDKFYSQVKQLLQGHVQLLEDEVQKYHPQIILGQTAFGFAEYTHRGPGRFEVLFDPTHEIYTLLRETLEPQWIRSVCQYLDTDDTNRLNLNISCVYSRPGATDQEWHTDGDHYNRIPSSKENNNQNNNNNNNNNNKLCFSKPYAVCIFVPLIPLTKETGYTRFWPKSHCYNLLGLAQAADTCLQATVDAVNFQVGDYLMYDYTTWHKGMANTTSDTERPIIQFLYSCDWYKERKNYGTRSVFDIVG
jgi:hypothetical protein